MKYFLLLLFITTSLFSVELEKPKTYLNQNIKGWVMSEKLDGIRAYWDGEKLLSKHGNQIHHPKAFTKNFPPFKLDGELWTKRNDFESIQSIVLDKTPSIHWKLITYNIFESPQTKGNFTQRLKRVKQWFHKHQNVSVQIIPQIKCNNKKELEDFLEQIIKLKGEGVIIKNPNLSYISQRSSNSLKVKRFKDSEGIVIGRIMNGKRLKSLKIRLPNEVVFKLGGGFSTKERLNPPRIGDTVTYKFYGLTKNGKPKFASFLRVRKKE